MDEIEKRKRIRLGMMPVILIDLEMLKPEDIPVGKIYGESIPNKFIDPLRFPLKE